VQFTPQQAHPAAAVFSAQTPSLWNLPLTACISRKIKTHLRSSMSKHDCRNAMKVIPDVPEVRPRVSHPLQFVFSSCAVI
jgi:hypothetical protein